MHASKENAREAKTHVRQLRHRMTELGGDHVTNFDNERLDFVSRFLEAAEKKLPTQAAFTREAAKRRKSK